VGFSAGDVDLYRAEGNNPTDGVDPSGMADWRDGFLQGFVSGDRSPRGRGIAQAIGGIGESLLGAALFPETFGVSTVMILHGLDNTYTGTKIAITGQYEPTITAENFGEPIDDALNYIALFAAFGQLGRAFQPGQTAMKSCPAKSQAVGRISLPVVEEPAIGSTAPGQGRISLPVIEEPVVGGTTPGQGPVSLPVIEEPIIGSLPASPPASVYNISTEGMTAAERSAIIEYAQRANIWLSQNGPTTVQGTAGGLRSQANAAARTERLWAARAGQPYQGQVGHVPDTAITGQATPPAGWVDMPGTSNQAAGGGLSSRIGTQMEVITVDGQIP
jgi:hypothetical protein